MSAQSSTMNTSESTPLLNNETSNQNVEAQKVSMLSRQYWGVQTFTALSLFWCFIAFIFGFTVTLYIVITSSSYYYIPYTYSYYLSQGGIIIFWTAIASVLNYARLRNDRSELPWSLNLIIDFVVAISGLWVSVLYIAVSFSSGDQCQWSRGVPVEVCHARVVLIRLLGLFEMIAVMLLSFTHIILLFLRVRNSARSDASSNGTSRGDGWFCGLGRGPLGVAVRSLPENRATQ